MLTAIYSGLKYGQFKRQHTLSLIVFYMARR